MTRELPRYLVSGTAVLVLHALLLLALAAALYHPAGTLSPAAHLVEVFVHLPQRTLPQPEPQLLAPARGLTAPAIVEPQIDIAPEAPPAAALQGFGRALFGCSPDKLATMTAEERARCPHIETGKPQEPSLRLGPYDPNSAYAQTVAKRNEQPVPVEHACGYEQASPLSNLGMPCFDFTGGADTGLPTVKQ
ncbi:MAG: hypothetical protein ABSD74_06145 [Rhizomicrobium sp.]|jgi:hypothetical protein